MTVKDLIDKLQTLPQEAIVACVYDGNARSNVIKVWLAKSGDVLLADDHETVYDDEDRPEYAPTSKVNRYWDTHGVI